MCNFLENSPGSTVVVNATSQDDSRVRLSLYINEISFDMIEA